MEKKKKEIVVVNSCFIKTQILQNQTLKKNRIS